MSGDARAQPIRIQRRDDARRAVADAALRLFVRQGFHGVTAAAIAAEAGVSTRSFFRYFPTKEDAALAALEPDQARVVAALAAQPAGLPIWDALRAAFDVLGDGLDVHSVDVARLYVETPDLRAGRIAKHAAWSDALLPVVRARLDADGTSPRDEVEREVVAGALIASALGCLDAVTEGWVRSAGEAAPSTLLAIAFGAIGEGGGAASSPASGPS